jgi:hypothetical protein
MPEGGFMKKIALLITPLLLLSCKQTTTQPQDPPAKIVAHVYSGSQGVSGVRIELVQTGTIVMTNKDGIAEFKVRPGSYDVRAFGIQGPGPALRQPEYHVNVGEGETARIEVFDCLACM